MKIRILSKENITPLIIFFISFLLLVCLTFSVLDLLNHIIIGAFGVSAYIILLMGMCWSFAKVAKLQNKFTRSFIVHLVTIAFSLMFIIHLAVTGGSYGVSFIDCLKYPFSNLTPAGAVFSFILFPLRLILPMEAVVCIFVLVIIILGCLIVDKMFHHKHLKNSITAQNKCERIENIKNKKDVKVQTMKIPNATMEKNKNMPNFISMPLTLNAKVSKEEKDKKEDLLTPVMPVSLSNYKKSEIPKKELPIKNDPYVYREIINSDISDSKYRNMTLEEAKESSEIKPLRPQKFIFEEENEIIGKPQTLLKEKNIVNDKLDEDIIGFKESYTPVFEDDFWENAIEEVENDISMPIEIDEAVEPIINNATTIDPREEHLVIESPKPKRPAKYVRPPIDLLTTKSTIPSITQEKFEEKAHIIEEKFEEFKISVRCVGVTRGPAITRYEFEMPQGVTVNKVLQYSNDISMVLESRKAIRIEAPIPGKNAFGIEVPNDKVDTIGLRDIIDTKEFKESSSPLTFALGKDITSKPVLSDAGKLVHTLVAGSTGSGKSVCMNSIIISLLYKASPADVRIILIDPKFVEFNIYENLPHLLLPKIITEPAQAVNALSWACEEMERRNRIFGQRYVRSIDEFNDMQEVKDGTIEKMYKIVIMVDELADLMLNTRKEIEEKILKLSQKARSSGIHLILATQRPSVDIITGTIKANLPSRIAFSLTNFNDSKTIIDQSGAEKLLGRGDMLYCPRGEEPTRLLGPFISQQEVASIVKFIKENNRCDYDPEIEKAIMIEKTSEASLGDGCDASKDEYYKPVLRNLIETQMCSISSIQRRFNIGFNRAARIVDDFVSRGYISKADGTKPRQIFITMDEFLRLYGDKN